MNPLYFRRRPFLYGTICLAVWVFLSARTPVLSQEADPEARGP